MYKFHLVFRYLRRRRLTYVAAAGEALCVFMMLVAVTVMNGFLHKAETAAKGLHGDVVIQPQGVHGIALYDEAIREVLAKVPEVEGASPMIISYGILRVPGADHYRQAIQIVGVRLPDRADVSDFEQGLFVQAGWAKPTFDPPIGAMVRTNQAHMQRIEDILDQMEADTAGAMRADQQRMRDKLRTAQQYLEAALDSLHDTEGRSRRLAQLQKRLIEAEQIGQPTEWIERQIEHEDLMTLEPMPNRIILGLGLEGAFFRTEQGETIRILVPGTKVTLYVFPLGQRSLTDVTPNIQRVTVVDDCTTDVYPFDSETVYVPFDALQRLNNMGPVELAGGGALPGRCSMIHVKVADEHSTRRALPKIAARIRQVVAEFYDAHPEAEYTPVEVLTWRQKQHKVVDQLESQRTLVMVMFLILSLVSVLLVFVIFYMLVVQKTRDIGVLKAIGASSSGVAAIFLAIGAAVGLVGAGLGAVGGCVFVHYINPIHDAVHDWIGYSVWSRESFWFDRIPNEIEPLVVAGIVAGAVIAGVLGALLPAIRAARMQPVEALRYE